MQKKIRTLLQLHDACQGLSEDEIDLLSKKLEVLEVEADEVIYSPDESTGRLVLVGAGRLKMMLKLPDESFRTVRYIGTGDQFGALTLVTDEKLPMVLRAEEKSLLFCFDKDIALQLADELPLFRRNLLVKLGLGVKDALIKRRKRMPSKVVAFLNAGPFAHQVISDLAVRLTSIGEQVGILGDSENPQFDSQISYKSILDKDGGVLSVGEVRMMVKQWPQMDRVFIAVERFRPADKLNRLIELADTAFFASPTDPSGPAIGELRQLIADSPSWKRKMHLIWVLNENEQVGPVMPDLPDLVERDFKVRGVSSETEAGLVAQGIDRIVHYLRGVSVGIALSGGAAHGMTHLGVLKALEEAGIVLDRMSGTSAGVLTGVIYGAGFSPDWGIEHFSKDLTPGSFFKRIPKGDSLYMLMKYRTRSWDRMLRKYLGDWTMEQFAIPISTITTDIVSASPVVCQTGDAVKSILESINIPVISAPICRDGMLLVDGGLLNNLPADVLVNQGCNFVMGIDVSANIAHRVGSNLPDTPTQAMKTPNAMTTLMRCLNVQAHNMSSIGAQAADVIIAPDVSKFDATAFSETPAMAKIGYQATVDAIPQIRRYLHHLDSDLFSA